MFSHLAEVQKQWRIAWNELKGKNCKFEKFITEMVFSRIVKIIMWSVFVFMGLWIVTSMSEVMQQKQVIWFTGAPVEKTLSFAIDPSEGELGLCMMSVVGDATAISY